MNESQTRPTPVRRAREPFLPVSLAMLAAPLTWVLHFALLYLLEGFLCTPMLAFPAAIPVAIAVATALGAGVCAWLLFASRRWLRRSEALESGLFLISMQRLLAGLSLVAILWGGSGALLLAPCTMTF